MRKLLDASAIMAVILEEDDGRRSKTWWKTPILSPLKFCRLKSATA